MRVLTLTTLFPNHRQPNHGVFVYNRVKALARYAEVRVVAPVPWAPPGLWGEKYRTFRSITDQELVAGLPTYHPRYLVIPKMLVSRYGDFYFWSLRRFMERIHRQYPFDVLDVHWAYPDGYAGVALARRLGVPVCVSLRGSDIHTYPKSPAIRGLIGATLAKADRVIAVAASMLPLVEGVGVSRERVVVLPNGVDTERFAPMPREAAREELGLPRDAAIILAVGRLESPKRFDLLIDAFLELCRIEPRDLRLVIVGKGRLGEDLKSRAAKHSSGGRVHFAGEVPNDSLAAWYNAADLLCLPSDNEGCPNVLLESAACGTPFVASNVGGVSELVCRENGIAVPANTKDAWVEALRTAIATAWDRREVAATAAGRSWDRIGKRVFEEFLTLVG